VTFSAFTTVAGNGKAGYSGDGRPASEGQFSEPHDVGVDTDGNLYIPDYGNNRIRKVTKEGVISTVVGNAYVVTARMVARPPLPNSLDREVWPWIPPETTRDEKDRLLFAAKEARSPVIYPALMLALNAGMRDAEIRNMQWLRLDLSNPRPYLVVGNSKTDAGEGRTIPLNAFLLEALVEYSKWYTKRFGTIQPDWYVFPFGKPRPKDPTKPMVSLRTAWRNVRSKAKVKGRWHDSRHTFITELAESGKAGDETIRVIAGHASKQMLKHYSHIGMEAKRRALEALVPQKPEREEAAINPIPSMPKLRPF
jgi:integrase